MFYFWLLFLISFLLLLFDRIPHGERATFVERVLLVGIYTCTYT